MKKIYSNITFIFLFTGLIGFSQQEETKKGQAGKGRGGKHTDVVTEDADGGDGDISKKSKASLAEETKTEMDQVDGRIDVSTSDKGEILFLFSKLLHKSVFH